MVNTTYDPILEAKDLRRFRLVALAPPRLGTVLVLEAAAAGEPLVIRAGEQIPEPHVGNYKRSFLVDVGLYSLRLEEALPTADPSFQFQAAISFNCRVEDPAEIPRRNIRDMTAAVRPPLVRILRRTAQQYDVGEFGAAEQALNDQLSRYSGDRAVRVADYLVELSAGAAATTSGADFLTVRRTTRLDETRREAMSRVVRGGQDEMIAQWLMVHGGDPSHLMEVEAAKAALAEDNLLEAMRIVAASNGDKPAWETREERRRLVNSLLGGETPVLGPAERGRSGSRRSRLAGTLNAAAGGTDGRESKADGVGRLRGSAGPVAEPTVADVPAASRTPPGAQPPPQAEPGANDGRGQRRPSRVRGVTQQSPPPPGPASRED